jgi:hypothetical protein
MDCFYAMFNADKLKLIKILVERGKIFFDKNVDILV